MKLPLEVVPLQGNFLQFLGKLDRNSSCLFSLRIDFAIFPLCDGNATVRVCNKFRRLLTSSMLA